MLYCDDTVYTQNRKHANCHVAFDSDRLLSQFGKSKFINYKKLLKNPILLSFLLLTMCKRKSTLSVFQKDTEYRKRWTKV